MVLCNGKCYFDEAMDPFCIYCNVNSIRIGNVCYRRTHDNCYMNGIGE